MKTTKKDLQLSLFDANNEKEPREIAKEPKVISLKDYKNKKLEEKFRSYSDHLL